jgi:hypothetical protein
MPQNTLSFNSKSHYWDPPSSAQICSGGGVFDGQHRMPRKGCWSWTLVKCTPYVNRPGVLLLLGGENCWRNNLGGKMLSQILGRHFSNLLKTELFWPFQGLLNFAYAKHSIFVKCLQMFKRKSGALRSICLSPPRWNSNIPCIIFPCRIFSGQIFSPRAVFYPSRLGYIQQGMVRCYGKGHDFFSSKSYKKSLP